MSDSRTTADVQDSTVVVNEDVTLTKKCSIVRQDRLAT
jgi:hypothetical protein